MIPPIHGCGFQPYKPVLPPLFVNRIDELKRLRACLVEAGQSALLTGARAIGKTSLLRTLGHEFSSTEDSKVLFVHVDLSDLHQSGAGVFLKTVLIQLCYSAYDRLTGDRYSDFLSDSLSDLHEAKIAGKPKQRLLRISRLVSGVGMESKASQARKVGASLVAGVEAQESQWLAISRGPLQSFEFMNLVDEIKEILRPQGIDRIIISCDEANHLPKSENIALLRQYFETFSSKSVAFAFVAYQTFPQELLNVFGDYVPIPPFQDADTIQELFEFGKRYCYDNYQVGIEASDEVASRLLELTSGHPMAIQLVCEDAFASSLQRADRNVTIGAVEQATLDHMDRIARYRSMVTDWKSS